MNRSILETYNLRTTKPKANGEHHATAVALSPETVAWIKKGLAILTVLVGLLTGERVYTHAAGEGEPAATTQELSDTAREIEEVVRNAMQMALAEQEKKTAEVVKAKVAEALAEQANRVERLLAQAGAEHGNSFDAIASKLDTLTESVAVQVKATDALSRELSTKIAGMESGDSWSQVEKLLDNQKSQTRWLVDRWSAWEKDWAKWKADQAMPTVQEYSNGRFKVQRRRSQSD